ncbi:MAG: DUF11 domain-containing protein, partial [Chloroflexi bacterium]
MTNVGEASVQHLPPATVTLTAVVTPAVHLTARKFVKHIYSSDAEFAMEFYNPSTTPITDLNIIDRVPTNTLFSSAELWPSFCTPIRGATIRVHNSPSLSPPPLNDPGWRLYSGLGGPYGTETRWVHWHIPSLSNQQANLSLYVRHIGLWEGTLVKNTAWYTGAQVSGLLTATYVVPPQPTFDLSPEILPPLASPGQEAEFRIYYRNLSNITTTHVLITATLPITVSFVSADQGGAYISGTHQVVWNLGAIGSGASGYVIAHVLVPRGILDRSHLCYQVVLD